MVLEQAGRLAGWVAGWLVGWLATKTVENAYPQHESASKMRTLRQKVDVELKDAPRGVAVGGGKKCGPFARKCVENAHP